MVDIKGLDKARVLKALYDHSHVQGSGFLQAVPEGVVTVEHCAGLLEKQTYFDYLHGRVLKVELSGDEFDECLYDRDCGEGAAQRAVDSIKGAPEDKDATKEADGEKKEPTMEEKMKLTKEAVGKIIDILTELPPDVAVAASVLLKTMLPGPSMGGMAGLLMMGGPLTQPPLRRFDIRGPKERDIMSSPFPFKGRFG